MKEKINPTNPHPNPIKPVFEINSFLRSKRWNNPNKPHIIPKIIFRINDVYSISCIAFFLSHSFIGHSKSYFLALSLNE